MSGAVTGDEKRDYTFIWARRETVIDYVIRNKNKRGKRRDAHTREYRVGSHDINGKLEKGKEGK